MRNSLSSSIRMSVGFKFKDTDDKSLDELISERDDIL